MTTKTEELFEVITTKIIKAIESNADGNWDKPWTTILGAGGLGFNASTKKAYRGFNQFVLMFERALWGYDQNIWATYKQYEKLGGQVKKGEHGTKLVKWGKTYRCDIESCESKGRKPCPKPNHESSVYMWASGFTVFNIAQQEGFEFELPDLGGEPERLAHVEEFIENSGANIQHVAGDRAYYNRSYDKITLPLREQFDTLHGFYGTALHEITHWTGHESRLDREFGKVFGNETYAGEELVAELGATFLAAHFGVEVEPHLEHANYLKYWLSQLKEDPRALYRGASEAQKAVEFLLNGDFESMEEAA